MKQISKIGYEMLLYQTKLAEEYQYAPIEPNLFTGNVRQKYKDALPIWCSLNGDQEMELLTLAGSPLCKGYKRIVIGDYGAFVEISSSQINKSLLRCKKGQEYRYLDERYATNVKYLWLTAKDSSDCKIYLQKKPVSYADYRPGMYYISPYEVLPVTDYFGTEFQTECAKPPC